MFSTSKPLSSLEHVVMEFLWNHGDATAEEVREALHRRRPMKDSTVRTILRRLETKGYARHRVDGRTFVYSGTRGPENVAVSAVRQIIDKFCGGSVEQLLVGMVDNEVLDEGELRDLAQKIARRKRAKGGE